MYPLPTRRAAVFCADASAHGLGAVYRLGDGASGVMQMGLGESMKRLSSTARELAALRARLQGPGGS